MFYPNGMIFFPLLLTKCRWSVVKSILLFYLGTRHHNYPTGIENLSSKVYTLILSLNLCFVFCPAINASYMDEIRLHKCYSNKLRSNTFHVAFIQPLQRYLWLVVLHTERIDFLGDVTWERWALYIEQKICIQNLSVWFFSPHTYKMQYCRHTNR